MPPVAKQYDETDRLLAELRSHGIDFLTGGRDSELAAEVARHPLPPAELLSRLAASKEPSVRDATIALLLLHPELARYLPSPTPGNTNKPVQQLAVLAQAAAYLQRIWSTRLALALGPKPDVTALYWPDWHLPDPDVDPKYGLRKLASREHQRLGRPVNYLSMWQQQVDHLTAQVWRRRRYSVRPGTLVSLADTSDSNNAAPGAVPIQTGSQRYNEGAYGMPHAPRGGTTMSMRAPADRERIERFLVALGNSVREPGRVYLVGGTTMVYEGFRATTVDIDVVVEADQPGNLIAAIRQLKDALDINVEFASPRDFIPLPAGWRERSIYIGRYGSIDVFHFDLYSMALSKIERGNERDFQDVVALLKSGRLDAAKLDAAFHEILPRVVTEGHGGIDPAVFEEHYRYLRSLLEEHP